MQRKHQEEFHLEAMSRVASLGQRYGQPGRRSPRSPLSLGTGKSVDREPGEGRDRFGSYHSPTDIGKGGWCERGAGRWARG